MEIINLISEQYHASQIFQRAGFHAHRLVTEAVGGVDAKPPSVPPQSKTSRRKGLEVRQVTQSPGVPELTRNEGIFHPGHAPC